MRTHPRSGFEFDWIAADRDGRVALMSTAGYGNCPAEDAEWMEQMDGLAEAIAAMCKPPTEDPLKTRPPRGPIIYDWRHWDGPYARLHVPAQIITIEAMNERGLDTDAVHRFECSFLATESIPDQAIRPEKAEPPA